MKTAGKWVLRIVIAIVVLILIVVGVFLFAGNQLIKIGIVKGATSALKVPVELGSVSLHPFAGKVELKNLVVGNPAGYEIPHLMTLGEGRVEVKLGSLMGDTVDIDYIILDNVELLIEEKGLSTNLNDIIKSLPKSTEQAQEQKPGKKLRIETLEINNVHVTVKLLPIPGKTSQVTLKLEPIKMTNLGSDNKMDMAALSSKILAAIAEGVAKQGTDLLPSSITGPLKSELGEVGHLLKGAGTETGKMGKGLFGIFKKDANSKK